MFEAMCIPSCHEVILIQDGWEKAEICSKERLLLFEQNSVLSKQATKNGETDGKRESAEQS
jgi:hypothetical protein